MSDRPEERSGGRRRGGPLGDDVDQSVDQSARTRREPLRRASGEDATQQIPPDDATQRIPREERAASRGGSSGRPSSDTQEFEAPTRAASRGEEARQRYSKRSSGGRSGGLTGTASTGGYSTGYSDVLRDREEYLRDIYGGVDWLASFVGFVFTLLCSAALGAVAVVFLLVPLRLGQSLSGGQLTSNAITGFAVIAGVIFLSFLIGGYVSGRMARYDGARNGAMVLLWTALVAALALVLSRVLGQAISGTVAGNLVGDAVNFGVTATDLVSGLGGAGYIVAGGVLLAAVLGGMLGGRLGSRYHREIDYTP